MRKKLSLLLAALAVAIIPGRATCPTNPSFDSFGKLESDIAFVMPTHSLVGENLTSVMPTLKVAMLPLSAETGRHIRNDDESQSKVEAVKHQVPESGCRSGRTSQSNLCHAAVGQGDRDAHPRPERREQGAGEECRGQRIQNNSVNHCPEKGQEIHLSDVDLFDFSGAGTRAQQSWYARRRFSNPPEIS